MKNISKPWYWDSLYKNSWEYIPGIKSTVEDYYPCRDGSDCCDNDYCRCREITDVKIEFDLNEFAKSFSDDPFLNYALERVLTSLEVYNGNRFQGNWSGGYYGAEFDGVTLLPFSELYPHLEAMKGDPSDLGLVKIALMAEYNKLTTAVQKCTEANIVNTNVDSLILESRGQEEMVKRNPRVPRYSSYILPMAVCTAKGNKYKVIDGYHRLQTAIDKGQKKVPIIVLS